MINLDAQPALPLEQVIARALDPGLITFFYRLAGRAGQELYFDGLGSNTRASWRLFVPNNQTLGSANLTGDFEVTLPAQAAYLLALDGNSDAPIPYSIRVSTPNEGQSELNTPPAISDLPDQSLPAGLASIAVAFFVSDAETPPERLMIEVLASNPSLFPTANLLPAANILLGGSGGFRTATLYPVPGQLGTSVVAIAVADAGEASAVTEFTLTVVAAPPRITQQAQQRQRPPGNKNTCLRARPNLYCALF